VKNVTLEVEGALQSGEGALQNGRWRSGKTWKEVVDKDMNDLHI